MRVVGVDIGIVNMGLSVLRVDEEGHVEVEFMKRVDITEYVCEPACLLHHTPHVVDRMNHFLATYSQIFEGADVVAIERQPPGGIVHVESLIYERYRHKAVLVSPNQLHRHFMIDHLDYDGRKDEVVKITGLSGEGRLHDVADSILIARFHIESNIIPKIMAQRPVADLDAFRY